MTSILIFAAGAALLVYSAEKLIVYLVGAAGGLHISVFLLAIVFTGIEFDDVAFGVVLNVDDLGEVALGTVFGTATAMTGIVLALTAIVAPTRVNIPRSYLVLFAVAPLAMIPCVLALIADRDVRRGPRTPVRRVHRLRRRQGAAEHDAGLPQRRDPGAGRGERPERPPTSARSGRPTGLPSR